MRMRNFDPGRWTVVTLLLAGCAAEVAPEPDVEETEQALRPSPSIAFEELIDPEGIGTAGESETRIVITRARQYARLFGHAPPAGVDFASGDAVVFYSAGVQRTGGYVASILDISRNGRRLRITTQLESPGEGCIVTQALSKPHVLVKFRMPPRIRNIRFRANDVVRDCPETDPCAAVRCARGSVCEVQADGTAACVPSGPFCGGIAGFPCEGAAECIDDPTDDCDPNMGGADCSGVCVCEVIGVCEQGLVWDESPEVCGCVPEVPDENPCAVTLCPVGTTCVLELGQAWCVSDGTLECGNSVCAEGNVCCNPSCGICTPPGGVCIQIACDGNSP